MSNEEDRIKNYTLGDVNGLRVANKQVLVEVQVERKDDSKLVLSESIKKQLKENSLEHQWGVVIKTSNDLKFLKEGDKVLVNHMVKPTYLPDRDRPDLYLINEENVAVYRPKV